MRERHAQGDELAAAQPHPADTRGIVAQLLANAGVRIFGAARFALQHALEDLLLGDDPLVLGR